ncbi:hypothetical protein C8R41DRAFT_131626 [Lentinula lateritia]|uniref:Secreted protein n=1 Tax=Lentinula lateritia TaxID=40482 RepID=A0ABQ8UWV3_9AGAR|nr:hypothetical protein C8R41DRAFT_131626 [Lentinula lateritia]
MMVRWHLWFVAFETCLIFSFIEIPLRFKPRNSYLNTTARHYLFTLHIIPYNIRFLWRFTRLQFPCARRQNYITLHDLSLCPRVSDRVSVSLFQSLRLQTPSTLFTATPPPPCPLLLRLDFGGVMNDSLVGLRNSMCVFSRPWSSYQFSLWATTFTVDFDCFSL